jgi:hypothetical protein
MTRRSAVLTGPLAIASAAICANVSSARAKVMGRHGAHSAAPVPDVIGQNELQEVIDAESAQRRRCVDLVHRLAAGATIERGRWTAEGDPKEVLPTGCNGLWMLGLDINETRSILEKPQS